MNIQKGYLYFIKDLYFDKVQDDELLKNKENGNKRPAYYCFKDNSDDDILWFVPISSRVEKYKQIYDNKIKKQLNNHPNKKPKVLNFVFGDVGGKENVFLIQNMFPVIDKYIIEKFYRKNKPVTVSADTKKEINSQASEVLLLTQRGYKKQTFPDILKIKKIMKQEIIKDIQISNFFNTKKLTFLDEVINIVNESISNEDLELYFKNINDKFIKNDLNKIINKNIALIDVKNELNKYILKFSNCVNQASAIQEKTKNFKDINLLTAIYNKTNDKAIVNCVIKMLDSSKNLNYDMLYQNDYIEKYINYCNEIVANKLILEDYYNENIKSTGILDIRDMILKSKSLYETKEYIEIIKDSNPKFNYDFNKLDYTKELKELNNDVGDIIGDIEIDNYIELLYNKYNQTLSKERIYNIYDFTNNKDVFDDVVDNIYKKVKDKELKLTNKNIEDTVDAVEKDIRISKSFKGLNNIESKETVEKIYSFTSNKSLFEDIVNKIDSNINYKPDKMDNEHLYHYVGEVENDLIR